MKKRYLLLFCLSFLCSHKIWADVGSIQIRLNENMQVVDLATSAVSNPTIDEVFVQQGGLTTAAEEKCTFDENGVVQPETVGCICPDGFDEKKDAVGASFCCNNAGQACRKVDNDNRCSQEVMLIPLCGCPEGEYPWNEEGTSRNTSNPRFCCDTVGAYESAQNDDGSREKDYKTDVDVQFYCGACPKGSIILEDEKTCCNAEGKRYQGGTWGVSISEECYCAIADTETRNENCQDENKCENTPGMEWCEAGVCMPEDTCPCVPGRETSPCTGETACTTQGGCWINNSCEEEDPEKCAQRKCEAQRNNWCITGGKGTCQAQQCTCIPGADENNYCIQTTCEAANGCWYNGTCNAKGTCSADQPWDNNICACVKQCDEGKQRTAEGDCIPCPTGGEVKGDAGDYLCCNGDKQWYIEEADSWSLESNYAKCGCPEGQYLEGNQCFSCINDTHCTNGKVCDIDDTHTCVECTNKNSTNCTGGKVCNAEKKCDCPEGTNWNGSACVECDGNFNSNANWPCPTSDKPLCSNGVCIACTTVDQTKPYWHNGQCVECTENDPCSDGVCQTETNTCVQCLTDDNCSNNPNNKHCVNNQCVQCTETEHCAKGLCVGNKCVACTTGEDCQAGEWCDLENGLCVTGCNTTMVQNKTNNTCYCDKTKDSEDPSKDSKTPVWDKRRNRCVSCFRYNEKTPVWNGTECEPCGPIAEGSDRLKVWDLYNEKCVRCYDSISANWTDLGCGSTVNHSDYNPRQDKWLTTGEDIIGRVCKVDTTNTDNNKCVQCTEHSHCPTNQKCKNNICMECDGNDGTDADLPCPNTKPLCSNGVCIACPANKYWQNGECVACSRNHGAAGNGYECPSTTPACHDGICKTCTDVNDKTTNEPTAGLLKGQFGTPARDSSLRGCYLCINDKTDGSPDTGCPSEYPICPTASDKGYNVCCPTNAPKWKDGKCVTCAAVDPKKPIWNGSACVQCAEDNDCGGGKYCHNNTCKDCTDYTRCGCTYFAVGGQCVEDNKRSVPTDICPPDNLDNIFWPEQCKKLGYDSYCYNHNSTNGDESCRPHVVRDGTEGEKRTPQSTQ